VNILDIFKKKGSAASQLPGLDITPSSLLLLDLKKSADQYTLTHYANAPLPATAMAHDIVQQSDTLTQAVARVKSLSNVTATQVTIATPSSLLMSKEIKLNPAQATHELEAAAWREAKTSFAHFSDDLLLDFSWLDESKHQALLTAARKKPIEARIAALNAAKLSPHIIDIDYLALSRSFCLIHEQLPTHFNDSPVALIHIDAQSILLTVIHGKRLITTFYQRYHGETLLYAIREKQGFNSAKTPGEQHEAPDLSLPALQIKYLLHHVLAKHPVDLAGLVLCGNVALIDDIDAAVSEACQLKTVIADPFKSMNIDKSINHELITKLSPAALLACGLALRGHS
jgi:type IV pilus assembly protein PilM